MIEGKTDDLWCHRRCFHHKIGKWPVCLCNRETLVSLLITKNDISMCSVPIVVILTTVYCIYTKSEERQQYLRHFQKLLKLCDEWSLCDVIERLSSLISRLSKMHTGDWELYLSLLHALYSKLLKTNTYGWENCKL